MAFFIKGTGSQSSLYYGGRVQGWISATEGSTRASWSTSTAAQSQCVPDVNDDATWDGRLMGTVIEE